jgi:AcrR family transcriptional regulator
MTEAAAKCHTKKAKRTKEQLLEAALKLFQEKGFERTTMRDIAKGSCQAVGAAYYYFKTKEEIVAEFYNRCLIDFEVQSRKIISETDDLEERLRRILVEKFKQLSPHRKFLIALTGSALNPSSPLSPFGPGTKTVRDNTIEIFKEALGGVHFKIPPALGPSLPRLFWLYHMGLIFFWMNDNSPGQAKTLSLTQQSLKIILELLKIARLPLMGALLKPITGLMQEFMPEESSAKSRATQ